MEGKLHLLKVWSHAYALGKEGPDKKANIYFFKLCCGKWFWPRARYWMALGQVANNVCHMVSTKQFPISDYEVRLVQIRLNDS